MKNTIIIDTGPIVALLNSKDKYHKKVLNFIKEHDKNFITTWSVITEATHLLRHSVQAQINLLEWIKRGGLDIFDIDIRDIDEMINLTVKYKDLPMDLADCSLVILAQKKNIRDILSIDSDYDVYRIFKKEPFNNLLNLYM